MSIDSESRETKPGSEKTYEELFEKTSTPESANENKPTVLGIIETLISIIIVSFLVWKTKNWSYIVAPSCIAPFLLLRTAYSTELGLFWYNQMVRSVEIVDAWQDKDRKNRFIKELHLYFGFIFFLVGIPIISLIIRLVATIITVIKHPLISLQAIPGNWFRIAFAIDSFHPPEIIPGIETASVDKRYRFSERLHRALTAAAIEYKSRSYLFKTIYTCGYFFQLGLLFVPALLYRWSLKSTFIVWVPLVWTVSTTRRGNLTTAQRLEKIMDSKYEIIKRWYSFFVVVFLIFLPFVFSAKIYHYMMNLHETLGFIVLDYWLFTGEIKFWHIARFISSAITLILYFLADDILHRIKWNHPYPENLINGFISSVLFVRAALGIYLALKFLHLLISNVDWISIDLKIVWW